MDIAEHDRLSRLALEREVAHVRRTQGERAARRAHRVLSVAIDDQRRALVQARLEAEQPHGVRRSWRALVRTLLPRRSRR